MDPVTNRTVSEGGRKEERQIEIEEDSSLYILQVPKTIYAKVWYPTEPRVLLALEKSEIVFLKEQCVYSLVQNYFLRG